MSLSAGLHERAMSAADRGDALRQWGDDAGARGAFHEAMVLEAQAAEAESTEPSRGILHRGAAWLAVAAEELAEAERLALAGLASAELPERVQQELMEVLEAARAGRRGGVA